MPQSNPPRHFNLISDPWIKVLDFNNQIQTISLTTLFNHPTRYQKLAGETNFQNLAVLRFILAILTTVYTRFDPDGQPYNFLSIDPSTMQVDPSLDPEDVQENFEDNADVLLQTWSTLNQLQHFTPIALNYLKRYQKHFDLFDPDTPFYQVTHDFYNSVASIGSTRKDFRIETGKGTIPITMLNRAINQSNNSKNVFNNQPAKLQNQISPAALIRWLITYQNCAGSSDKGKTQYGNTHRLSNYRGWLYSTTPVYLQGNNLFETIMLNFKLDPSPYRSIIQHPVWEQDFKSYLDFRLSQAVPHDLASLYTLWSRLFYIDWTNPASPIVFGLGLPGFEATDTFIEPMTVWSYRPVNSNSPAGDRPTSLSVDRLNNSQSHLWQNFGNYVPLYSSKDSENSKNSKSPKIPQIIDWIHTLQDNSLIDAARPLTLVLSAMASDGNTSSQQPAQEIYDEMSLTPSLVLEDPKFWSQRIEILIKNTQFVAADYYKFAKAAGNLAGLSDANAKIYATNQLERFYDGLNIPFNRWLSHLTIHDDRDQKSALWRDFLKQYSHRFGRLLLNQSSPQQRRGQLNLDTGKVNNIFTTYNVYQHRITKTLGPTFINQTIKKEDSKHA